MPLVVFSFFTLLCQSVTVGIGLLIDKFGPAWISVVSFGVLYIVAFGVAWKLTVWAIDTHLRPEGAQ